MSWNIYNYIIYLEINIKIVIFRQMERFMTNYTNLLKEYDLKSYSSKSSNCWRTI